MDAWPRPRDARPPPPQPPTRHEDARAGPPSFEMRLSDGPSPFALGVDKRLSDDAFAFPPLGQAGPPPPPAPPGGSPLYHLQYQQHLHRQQQQQQQQQRQFPPGGDFAMDFAPPSGGFLGGGADAFDLGAAMRDLHVGGAPPAFGSWDTASSSSLRDQMNQQMAALYQQGSERAHTPHALSFQSEQLRPTPLASSGSELLSSLLVSQPSSSGGVSTPLSGRYEPLGGLRDASPSSPSPLSMSFPPLDTSGSFPGMMAPLSGSYQHPQQPPLHYGALTPSRTRRSPAKSPPSHHFRPMREQTPRGASGDLPAGNAVSVTPDVTKPNDNIKVQISLKAEECTVGRVLMVGLFRLGQLSNEKPIFVKQVLFENKLNRNYRFLNTRITFRSPRSPGEFEFRVFEDKKGDGGHSASGGSTPKRHHHGDDHHGDNNGNSGGHGYSNFTIARSNRLKVCMEYNHFIDTLRATNDKFNQARVDGDAGAVLSALLSMLRLIDQVETVFLHGHALFGDLLDACLRLIAMNAEDVRSRFSPTDTIPNPMETFHGTMRNVLNAIQCNAFVRELVSDELLAEIEFFQRELYCQVSGLYFPSQEARHAYWQQHFGFEPVILPGNATNDEGSWLRTPFIAKALSSVLTRDAERLIPDREHFVARRQKIFDQLRSEVLATLSFHVDLDVFGSSANDFGSDGSDMDMCLVLPVGTVATVEQKQEMLLEVVRRLESRPDLFTAIDASRLTARIPIVMFTSTETGIECDLCVENALALRNTALLRAYANADRRVRVLAYTLKQFVKRRRMNCAAEGTLSSYGYLLMLIHYLQRQNPPLLPVLQSLPANWDGSSFCQCTADKSVCPPRSPHCRLSERAPEMQLPSVLCKGPNGELDPTGADATSGIETYFFDPFAAGEGFGEEAVASRLAVLEEFAGRNESSVGELWLGFLRYFGLVFDASRQVVSIRMARTLSKDEKRRAHQWRMHTRLSIEDPFEASYDVAHVLKGSRDKYIRQQFVRAYSLLMHQVIEQASEEHEGDGDEDSDWQDAERVLQFVNEQVVDVPFLHPHGVVSGHGANAHDE